MVKANAAFAGERVGLLAHRLDRFIIEHRLAAKELQSHRLSGADIGADKREDMVEIRVGVELSFDAALVAALSKTIGTPKVTHRCEVDVERQIGPLKRGCLVRAMAVERLQMAMSIKRLDVGLDHVRHSVKASRHYLIFFNRTGNSNFK